ncbi:MAG: ABC transporter ATP-binding protein [Phycisphaerales bacterium]
MIRCIGVEKDYHIGARAIHALRGVDLEIAEPGFYAIMGQSGSGKSTLLHLLAALDRPDKGTIEIAGHAVHQLREPEATLFRRKHVGIVFQQFNLIPTLKAIENVELPGMLAGEDSAPLRRRAVALLDRLGLADRAEHRPDALSGGEQQRVAIARALLFSPALVLADEPTGNLDSASAGKLWRLLRELSERERTTVVMVTHEPAAAANCRRVFVLSDGRVTGRIEVGNENEALDASGVASRYQQLVRTA